jgi:uncharacterized membrane protein
MLDALLEATALPNLHPVLVHFPIALAAVALLFDALAFVRPRWPSFDASGALLWTLAASGAGAAYLAGERAADQAGLLAAAAEAALGEHADAALATLVSLGALALFRIGLAWRDRALDRVRRDLLRGAALVAALAVQGLVAYTADLGGALVYRHGIAVSARPPEVSSALPTPRDAPRWGTDADLERLEDGSLLWRPRPGDAAAMKRMLEPLGPGNVRVERDASGRGGISLASSGSALLAFPGSWENVQVEMTIDTASFRGRLGLGARVDGEANGGLFRLATDGGAALVALREGEEEILDEMDRSLPLREVTLVLSVSGRHWKGFVDGESAVHGHVSARLPGRRAALLMDGTGTVRIVSVRITPLDGARAAGANPGQVTHRH